MTDLVKFNFRGDELDVIAEAGEAWVSVRRVCDALGIAFSPQRTKLAHDASVSVTMIVTQATGDDQAREIFCVSVRSLPLWLATIHPSKVSPAVRSKLVAYKREAADVLADHFIGRRSAANTSAQVDDLVEAFRRLLADAASGRRLISGARLRDNPVLADPVRRRFAFMATAQRISLQKAHGNYRRQFKLPSFLDHSVYELQVLASWFDEQFGGRMPALPANDRQMVLIGVA